VPKMKVGDIHLEYLLHLRNTMHLILQFSIWKHHQNNPQN